MSQRMHFSLFSLPAALTLTVLTACGPSPTGSQSSPGTLSTHSPAPINHSTSSPTESASVSPNPASSSLNSASTASPIPTPTSLIPNHVTSEIIRNNDISTVERTTFNGKIFDDTQAPLDGVTVTAKSLNITTPFDSTSTTAGGSYAFNNVPAGVQIEITVSKPGYTTRRRVEVLKSNKDGDPNANKYDFGAGASSNGSAANALSDKPEVIAVTPSRNTAGVSPTTSFVLKFSEPMDRASVIDNFEVRAFTNEKFSVDTTLATTTLTGSGDVNAISGTRIWDKSAFNFSWNSDDSEATFTFKEERALPSDKDTDKVPDYQVSLERQDAYIKDKSGISRSSSAIVADGGIGAFKLTEGNFERSFKFSLSADTKQPRIDSIMAQTAENSGANSDGDTIKIRFSERMIHYTLGPTIAGGMGGNASQAAGPNGPLTSRDVAANYNISLQRQGRTFMNRTSWANLDGRVVFDTTDPTHRTVLMLPGRITAATNYYLNNQILTTATNSYQTDNTAGTGGVYIIQFRHPNNTPIAFAVQLADNLTDNLALAANFQSRLNTASNSLNAFARPSTDAFKVTASAATNGSLNFVFNDTSGKYIGFEVLANPTGNGTDVLPNLMVGGSTNLTAGPIDVFRPGDLVTVEVETTVLDPAGNSLDSSGDDASANAS